MNGIITDVVSGCIMVGVGLLVELMRKQLKDMNGNFKKLHVEIMRVRILTLIYDDPHSQNEILDLFDDYEKAGGNGSTKQRVLEWKKREGID